MPLVMARPMLVDAVMKAQYSCVSAGV